MQGFTSHKTSTVVLSREDTGESLTFTLTALPVGWWDALMERWQAPRQRKGDGTPMDTDPAILRRYHAQTTYVLLAKVLEPSGVLETQLPPMGTGPDLWAQAGDAVKSELQAANLSEGEVNALIQASQAINRDVRLDDRLGNSLSASRPAEGG